MVPRTKKSPVVDRGFISFFLVMMVLMFLDQMLEIRHANGLVRGMDLRFRPAEDLFGLDAMDGVFYEFPILHHPLDIIGYPGLLFRANGHAHIAEKLLFGKGPDIFGVYFDIIFANHLVNDERPFQLVHERRELLFYFGLAFWLFPARLHPALQEVFGKFDLRLIEHYVIERMLELVAALAIPVSFNIGLYGVPESGFRSDLFGGIGGLE